MLNRQYLLTHWDAERVATRLILNGHATAVAIKKNKHGYWLNVSWKCDITAPLTIQETDQLFGE